MAKWRGTLVAVCAATTLMGCGQFGRKVASDVGNAITPTDNGIASGVFEASRRPGVHVRPGITVLVNDSLAMLRGLRVGLITNQTGVDEHGESDIDLLRSPRVRAAGVTLTKLFSPEHGIRGTEDREELASGVDARSGLVIHSLYTNGTIAPPDSTLRDLDALVVDLQDIGTRTWTYVGAMVYAMRAAARHHMPIVILDRPNPLGGFEINGPLLDPALANPYESVPGRAGRAYALFPTPLRHGATMAELARLFNDAMDIHADLRVVPMQGWKRELWFDETGLPWVRPSPNLPTLLSAATYPALVAFEGSNLSVGRGTPDAFQRFGAPWLRADSVLALLRGRRLPGVQFERSDYTPQAAADNKFTGRRINGIHVTVTDRATYDAGRTGAAILWAVGRANADSLVLRALTFDERFGRPPMREALLRGEDPDSVLQRDDPAVQQWRRDLARYRLYH